MAITNNEKEAIDIVIEMIDKRLNWLKNNDPEATSEIMAYDSAASWVKALEFLDLD